MSDIFKSITGKSRTLYKVSEDGTDDLRNIVIISSEFPPGPGGIGKHAFDLSRALVWKGFEITVFSSQDYASEEEILNFRQTFPSNLNLVRFSRNGWATYLDRWLLINNFLTKHNPELIIVTGRFPLWMGWLVKRKFGKSIPVHAFIHGSELSKKNRFHHFLTSVSLSSIDHIWAVSNFTRRLLRKLTDRKDILVLPNGLWLNDWPSENIKKSAVELTGVPSLITVGRVSSRKGQHLLVKALPEIQKLFPAVHYNLVGIPTGKEALEAIAVQYHVADDLTFHGKIPSIIGLSDYYQKSDVFIMLSETQPDGDTEGFGIAILEANYFGKPAIGARGCGIEDAIMDGYNGRLVEGNNPIEIAEALKDIMENYNAYSARARKWAIRHDWKILIDHFIKLEDVPFLTNINYEV